MKVDDLYTGNTGAPETFGNEEEQEVVTQEVTEQNQLIAELLPSAEYIRQVITEEIASVSDIRAYRKSLGEMAKPDEFEREYRARELYIEFLEELSSSIESKIQSVKEASNE